MTHCTTPFKSERPIQAVVIGCGGTGGFLARLLDKTLPRRSVITLYDSDIIEPRNLDRQLFDTSDVGRPKVDALADKLMLDTLAIHSFFTSSLQVPKAAHLFCCADNNTARLETIKAADLYGSIAVIMGNEFTDADAYYYSPKWKGTPLDPRSYYPELLNPEDPHDPNNCTGVALEAAPQLAISNSLAASYAMWLWWFWKHENNITDAIPVRVSSNFAKIKTITKEQLYASA
jgi:hypothetical protein